MSELSDAVDKLIEEDRVAWENARSELTRLRADIADARASNENWMAQTASALLERDAARAENARLREEVKEVIRVLILCDNPDTLSAARALEQALSTTADSVPVVPDEMRRQSWAHMRQENNRLLAERAALVEQVAHLQSALDKSRLTSEVASVMAQESINALCTSEPTVPLADAEALARELEWILAYQARTPNNSRTRDTLAAFRARHPAPAKDYRHSGDGDGTT